MPMTTNEIESNSEVDGESQLGTKIPNRILKKFRSTAVSRDMSYQAAAAEALQQWNESNLPAGKSVDPPQKNPKGISTDTNEDPGPSAARLALMILNNAQELAGLLGTGKSQDAGMQLETDVVSGAIKTTRREAKAIRKGLSSRRGRTSGSPPSVRPRKSGT